MYLSDNIFSPQNDIEKEYPILCRKIINNITSMEELINPLLLNCPNLLKTIIQWIPKQLSNNIDDALHIIENILRFKDIRSDCYELFFLILTRVNTNALRIVLECIKISISDNNPIINEYRNRNAPQMLLQIIHKQSNEDIIELILDLIETIGYNRDNPKNTKSSFEHLIQSLREIKNPNIALRITKLIYKIATYIDLKDFKKSSLKNFIQYAARFVCYSSEYSKCARDIVSIKLDEEFLEKITQHFEKALLQNTPILTVSDCYKYVQDLIVYYSLFSFEECISRLEEQNFILNINKLLSQIYHNENIVDYSIISYIFNILQILPNSSNSDTEYLLSNTSSNIIALTSRYCDFVPFCQRMLIFYDILSASPNLLNRVDEVELVISICRLLKSGKNIDIEKNPELDIIKPLFEKSISMCKKYDNISKAWINAGIRELNTFLKLFEFPDRSNRYHDICKYTVQLLETIISDVTISKNKNELILPILSNCLNTFYDDDTLITNSSGLLTQILTPELLENSISRLRRALKISISISIHYERLVSDFDLVSLSPLVVGLYDSVKNSHIIELLKLHISNLLSTNELFDSQIMLLSNTTLTIYRATLYGLTEENSGLVEPLIQILKYNFTSKWLLTIVLVCLAFIANNPKYYQELKANEEYINNLIFANWTDPFVSHACIHCASILGKEYKNYQLYLSKGLNDIINQLLLKPIPQLSQSELYSVIKVLVTIWEHDRNFAIFKRDDIIHTLLEVIKEHQNMILIYNTLLLLTLMTEEHTYITSLTDNICNDKGLSIFIKIINKCCDIKNNRQIFFRSEIILCCLSLFLKILPNISPDMYKNYFGKKNYIISLLNIMIRFSDDKELYQKCIDTLSILISKDDIQKIIDDVNNHISNNSKIDSDFAISYLDYLTLPFLLNKFRTEEAEMVIDPMNSLLHFYIQQDLNDRKKKKMFDKARKCIIRLFNLNKELSIYKFIPVLITILHTENVDTIVCLNTICENDNCRKIVVESHPEFGFFPYLTSSEVDENRDSIIQMLNFIITLEKEDSFLKTLSCPSEDNEDNIYSILGSLMNNTTDIEIFQKSLNIIIEFQEYWGENPVKCETLINALVKALDRIMNNIKTKESEVKNVPVKDITPNGSFLSKKSITAESGEIINTVNEVADDAEEFLVPTLEILCALFQNTENAGVVCSYSSNGIKILTELINLSDSKEVVELCVKAFGMICQTEDGTLCVTEYNWTEMLFKVTERYNDEETITIICYLLSEMFEFESMQEELCEALATSNLLTSLTKIIPQFNSEELNKIQSDLLIAIGKTNVYVSPKMLAHLKGVFGCCNSINDENEKQILPQLNSFLETLESHLDSENYQRLFIRIGGINCICSCLQCMRNSKYKKSPEILKSLIELLCKVTCKECPITVQIEEFFRIILTYDKPSILFDPIFTCFYNYSQNEDNCILLITKNAIPTFMKVIQYHPSNNAIQSWVCQLFEVFSKYDSSLILLIKNGVMYFIMMCAKKFMEDTTVLESSINVLSRLICNDILNDFINDDGITLLIDILKRRMDVEQIILPCLQILSLIIKNSDQLQVLINSGIINIVLSIMLMYTDDSLHTICKDILKKCISDNTTTQILKEVEDAEGNELIKGLNKLTILFSIPSIHSMVPAEDIFSIVFPILDKSLEDPTVCRLIAEIFGLFEYPQLIEDFSDQYDIIKSTFRAIRVQSKDPYMLYSLLELLYSICQSISFAEEFSQTNRLQDILFTVKSYIHDNNIINAFIKLLNRIGTLLPIDSMGWGGLVHSYTITIYKEVLDEIISMNNRELLLLLLQFFIIISKDNDGVRIENIMSSDIKDNIFSVINIYDNDIELLYTFLTLFAYWIQNEATAVDFTTKTLKIVNDILMNHKKNEKLILATLNYLVILSKYPEAWDQFNRFKLINKIQNVIELHLSVPDIVVSGNILLIKSGKELSDKYMMHVLQNSGENPDLQIFINLFNRGNKYGSITNEDALQAKYIMENRIPMRLLKIMEQESMDNSSLILIPAARALKAVKLNEEIAQLIAEESGIQIMVSILKKNISNKPLLQPLLTFASRLCMHDSLKTQINQNDGIETFLDIWNNALNEKIDENGIIFRCCKCLSHLSCYNDYCNKSIIEHNGITIIKNTIQLFKKYEAILNITLSLLSNILYNNGIF